MAKTSQPRKLSRMLLVGSLALNVALGGVIIGALATGNAGPPRGFEPQLGPIGQILPKEDREVIGREIRQALRRNAADDRRDRSVAMAQVVAALEADTFDPDALSDVIRGQQARLDNVREVALTSFINHVAQMPVEERRAIAATLKDRAGQGRGGKDKDRGPGN